MDVVYRYLVRVELENTFGMVVDSYLLKIIGPPNLTFEFFQIQKVTFLRELTKTKSGKGVR